MNERWRAIPGIPKLYLISDRGRVLSVRSRRVLAPSSSGFVILHIDREPVSFKVEHVVRAAFGFACDKCECECAANCWHCGFNPVVDAERKKLLQERGLTVTQSIAALHLDKSVLEDGWTDIENILPKKGEKTNDWK